MGTSIEGIARELRVPRTTLSSYINQVAGLKPDRWKDPDRFISTEERDRIQELLVEGVSIRGIARELDRAPSTISRELRRGQGGRNPRKYSPRRADRVAFENRRRPKSLKIPGDRVLLEYVQSGLDEKLSPEQIVGRLEREHPGDSRFRVSHETIYKTIYLQARGGLKKELAALTRTGRTVRHPKRVASERRGRIRNMVSIWDRPIEALDRSVPGHWEGDLIVGKDGKSAIGTVVERRSNYLILVWLDPAKNRVEATRDGLVAKLGALPEVLKGSLTWDQGKEMAQHQQIVEMTGVDVFFADPHSPWQRATNENTNGLLRQYFPKGTDLSGLGQADLDFVAVQMNGRPRKRLDFATPYETIREYLLR